MNKEPQVYEVIPVKNGVMLKPQDTPHATWNFSETMVFTDHASLSKFLHEEYKDSLEAS